ncbi:MAG: pyruvate formate lyase-activating protein [Tissierellia bacterium]|nr:pyruvate formate lyase-activating protein [Tissierellia bacterium]
MTEGYIHSIETLGTLDGPGLRMVVFLQGCNLRCIYCHNPDTWTTCGQVIHSLDLVEKAKRYKPYFKHNGGITFSGGEPLMQPEFLLECLILCKQKGIHTVIDTSGVGSGSYDEILKFTDLVILDIKHPKKEKYKKITGNEISHYKLFKEAVIKNEKQLWLKHVVTPGINDTKEDMLYFEEEVRSFPDELVQKVELLPYHTLGIFKYENLNIKYRLEGLPPLSKAKLSELKEYINLAKLIK